MADPSNLHLWCTFLWWFTFTVMHSVYSGLWHYVLKKKHIHACELFACWLYKHSLNVVEAWNVTRYLKSPLQVFQVNQSIKFIKTNCLESRRRGSRKSSNWSLFILITIVIHWFSSFFILYKEWFHVYEFCLVFLGGSTVSTLLPRLNPDQVAHENAKVFPTQARCSQSVLVHFPYISI